MKRHPHNPALNLSNTANHLKTNTKAENNIPRLGKAAENGKKRLFNAEAKDDAEPRSVFSVHTHLLSFRSTR